MHKMQNIPVIPDYPTSRHPTGHPRHLAFPTAWQIGPARYPRGVSKKSARIAAMIETLHGGEFDAHYLGYFECFNQGLYYEAHDVLEELWLPQRGRPNDLFYKGLIQLAGAFVHLQKERLKPSAALFRLARANLARYPACHENLGLTAVLALIDDWQGRLETTDYAINPLQHSAPPRLALG